MYVNWYSVPGIQTDSSEHSQSVPTTHNILGFNESHLKDLQESNYFVSEKADGVRVLLFTHNEQTFLVF